MHRDLAARNILVAGDKTCKVRFDDSLAMVRVLSCVYTDAVMLSFIMQNLYLHRFSVVLL